MHLAQELLMNVQCRVVQEVLQRRQEPWRWGVQWLAIKSWQRPIIKTDPLITTWGVAKELKYSMTDWHLKQIGKVKKLYNWVTHELTVNKKIILKCRLPLFYAKTTNHFTIGLSHVMKSGFYTTTGNDELSGWT